MGIENEVPELQKIIKVLKTITNRYEEIFDETGYRLQAIKRRNPIVKHETEHSINIDNQRSDTAIDEIHFHLDRLLHLIDRAEFNMNHLKEII